MPISFFFLMSAHKSDAMDDEGSAWELLPIADFDEIVAKIMCVCPLCRSLCSTGVCINALLMTA